MKRIFGILCFINIFLAVLAVVPRRRTADSDAIVDWPPAVFENIAHHSDKETLKMLLKTSRNWRNVSKKEVFKADYFFFAPNFNDVDIRNGWVLKGLIYSKPIHLRLEGNEKFMNYVHRNFSIWGGRLEQLKIIVKNTSELKAFMEGPAIAEFERQIKKIVVQFLDSDEIKKSPYFDPDVFMSQLEKFQSLEVLEILSDELPFENQETFDHWHKFDIDSLKRFFITGPERIPYRSVKNYLDSKPNLKRYNVDILVDHSDGDEWKTDTRLQTVTTPDFSFVPMPLPPNVNCFEASISETDENIDLSAFEKVTRLRIRMNSNSPNSINRLVLPPKLEWFSIMNSKANEEFHILNPVDALDSLDNLELENVTIPFRKMPTNLVYLRIAAASVNSNYINEILISNPGIRTAEIHKLSLNEIINNLGANLTKLFLNGVTESEARMAFEKFPKLEFVCLLGVKRFLRNEVLSPRLDSDTPETSDSEENMISNNERQSQTSTIGDRQRATGRRQRTSSSEESETGSTAAQNYQESSSSSNSFPESSS